MQAKKSLGQHFLKSAKALRQIVEAGNLHITDTVLEVGPGTGVLTNQLLQKVKTVIAVEKDRELIHYLNETFDQELQEKKLTILDKDILMFDPETMRWYGKTYKLIANIPYYITGAIIEQFLSAPFQPTQMVLLIQKEVAERIVAKNHKESVLSIAVKAYGTPVIIDKVPRGAFAPAPTVDSAIIAINGITRAFFTDLPAQAGCDEALFFSIMKAVFGKKRKQIGGSLGEHLSDKTLAQEVLKAVGIDPKTRPEDLKLTQWKSLTQAISERTSKENSVQ